MKDVVVKEKTPIKIERCDSCESGKIIHPGTGGLQWHTCRICRGTTVMQRGRLYKPNVQVIEVNNNELRI